MIELDLASATITGDDPDRDKFAAMWEDISARLLTDADLMASVQEATGSAVDLTTRAGLIAMRDLVNVLGDRRTGQHEQAVQEQVARMRATDEARARFASETAAAVQPLPLVALGALLDEDIAGEAFVVDDLLHRDGNVLFSAARKSGKSTTVGNLIRSLVDGVPFLGQFEVATTRRVVLVDLELSPGTLQRWLREQGIQNLDAVTVVPLRGRARDFDILNDATRTRLADALRGHDTIILDPLRPLADALGLNEHTEMGRLLEAFDALKAEAGISEGVIVHHHGHGSDRARGDSRLEDWPDAIWRLNRADLEDPQSPRFFSAFGRDVEVPKGLLALNGRHLSYDADIQGARDGSILDLVVAHLRDQGPSKSTALQDSVRGLTKNNAARVLGEGVTTGRLSVRQDGTARIYSLVAKPF